jgi:UrcA family protein
MTLRFASIALAAASIAALAQPALAQSPAVVREVVTSPSGAETIRSEYVTYGDLNLRHPEGAQALRSRIMAAAKRVCAPLPVYGENASPYRACVQKASSEATRSVITPTLAAVDQPGG